MAREMCGRDRHTGISCLEIDPDERLNWCDVCLRAALTKADEKIADLEHQLSEERTDVYPQD